MVAFFFFFFFFFAFPFFILFSFGSVITLTNLKEVDISYSMTDSMIALAFLQNPNIEIFRAGRYTLKLCSFLFCGFMLIYLVIS
jgi:hypothetical protein